MDICDLREVQELRIAPLPLPSTVLYLCPPTHTLFAHASHYEPTLFANVSWIAKSSADWLKCSPTSGDGETKLRIEVEPNASTTDERLATITFTPVGDTVCSYTLSITQKQNNYNPGGWLDQSKLFLRVGDTQTLVVKKQLESDQEVYWSSNDPRIASVENGKVTAHAEGETSIWARIDDQVAKCIVVVRGKGSAAHEVENFPSLTVSPNPFTDALRLDHHEPLTIAYQLLNPQGVVLRTGTLFCGETRLETENLPAGLYLLRLTSVDGAVRTLQVVKE